MSKSKEVQSYGILKWFVLTVLSLFFLGGLFVWWILNQFGAGIYSGYSRRMNQRVEANPAFFRAIYSDIFPQAIDCNAQGQLNCPAQIRPLIEQHYPPLPSARDEYTEEDWLKISGNLPIYFIKLDQDKIVKLFLSGDLIIEAIDRSGERKVRELLLGERQKLYGPIANDRMIPMTYLDDLPAEAEVIVPYRENGEIVGGIVYLYGD